jgi:hypothetical protein
MMRTRLREWMLQQSIRAKGGEVRGKICLHMYDAAAAYFLDRGREPGQTN